MVNCICIKFINFKENLKIQQIFIILIKRIIENKNN